ncbi:MAG: TldD/PmbA family protein [bacterium JZ-2024 1]
MDLEIIYTESEAGVTRLANNEIHQNVVEKGAEIVLRVTDNDRVVVVQTNDTRENELRDTVERARVTARMVPPLDVNPGLSEPASLKPTRAYDPRISRVNIQRRARWAEIFVTRAKAEGLMASGAISALRASVAYVNSRGVTYHADSSRVTTELILYDDFGSGYATASGISGEDTDPHSLAQEAAWRAMRSRHASSIDPGDYAVVLEPPAVADLLDFMGWAGFNAKMLEEHQSFLEDTIGKRAFSPLITILEDPFSRINPGLPFDYEGTPRQKVVLVSRGVVVGPVYDRRTAFKAGKQSTGNALPPTYNVGPLPLNLAMQAGDVSREDLIGKIKRGLLVTRFHYTNIVDARKLILTGMTRDGTFEIRNGEIARGVKNMRFTQNVVGALKEVIGVSRERGLVSSWFSGTLAPAIALRKFHFSSATLF